MKDSNDDANLRFDDIDNLGKALVTLTKEVWVLRDRQQVLEAALADAGVLESGALDAYEPDAATTARLEEERQRLIDNVLRTLMTGRDDRAGDD